MTRWLVLAVSIIAFADCPAQEAFQVTFGVRGPPDSLKTDGGMMVVEATDGDLVVAGHGASQFTDVGSRTRPMLARISRDGTVLWTRIYDDLEGQQILAVAESDGQHFVLMQETLRDPVSGRRPVRRQRVSTWRVGPDGKAKRELGALAPLLVHAAAADRSGEAPRFLVVATEVEEDDERSPYRRPPLLFKIGPDGTHVRSPLPSGVAAARHVVVDADGNAVLLAAADYFREPVRLVKTDARGSLLYGFPLGEHAVVPSHFASSGDVHYLIAGASREDKRARVVAVSPAGEALWQTDAVGFERVSGASAVADGGLVVTGSYENLGVATRISGDGRVLWQHRFRSAKAQTSPVAAAALGDGWLAVTGATHPGHGGFSSTDADAFLLVTDPAGDGLARFSGCSADAARIEALRDELMMRAGLTVARENPLIQRRSPDASTLPPLGERLPADLACGALSEHHLLAFLAAAATTARELSLQRASERADLFLTLRAQGALGSAGFAEARQYRGGLEPWLEAEPEFGREVMRYIATDVLPYAERMLSANDRIHRRMGAWFRGSRAYESAGGVPPFAVTTRNAERLVELFDTLTEERQASIRRRMQEQSVMIAARSDVLHLWGSGKLLVGSDRVHEAWDFVLDTLPALEEQIAAIEKGLQTRLALRIRKSDPDLLHADYLATLRQIAAAEGGLTDTRRRTIIATRATVEVGQDWIAEVGLRGYLRGVFMRPRGADRVLDYIAAHAPELQGQEYRE